MVRFAAVVAARFGDASMEAGEAATACAASAGGVNCAMSVSMSAGTARWGSFADAMDSWIACSRSTGPSTSVWSADVTELTRAVLVGLATV